jgi:hypothetical protein
MLCGTEGCAQCIEVMEGETEYMFRACIGDARVGVGGGMGCIEGRDSPSSVFTYSMVKNRC